MSSQLSLLTCRPGYKAMGMLWKIQCRTPTLLIRAQLLHLGDMEADEGWFKRGVRLSNHFLDANSDHSLGWNDNCFKPKENIRTPGAGCRVRSH